MMKCEIKHCNVKGIDLFFTNSFLQFQYKDILLLPTKSCKFKRFSAILTIFIWFVGAKSLMESFEQTASADNLTTNAEAKQTVEAMVNNVLSEAMMNLERQDKKRGGSSSGQESNDNDR